MTKIIIGGQLAFQSKGKKFIAVDVPTNNKNSLGRTPTFKPAIYSESDDNVEVFVLPDGEYTILGTINELCENPITEEDTDLVIGTCIVDWNITKAIHGLKNNYLILREY